MVEVDIERYDPGKGFDWNLFVESSNGGTLFHRLDFLSYHGERFKDSEHHLVFYKKGQVFGLMPMAIIYDTLSETCKSPYGGSYGGPVFRKPLNYADSREAIEALIGYISNLGARTLAMTLPIWPCYLHYSDTFRFVLMETGFKCINRDISSVICLEPHASLYKQLGTRLSNLARKSRKAQKEGVKLVHRAGLDDLWKVMEVTYGKHGVRPTHSREELKWLMENFPANIYCDIAYLEGMPIAAVVFFVINSRVICSFYLLQDPSFRKTQALTCLLHSAILRAQEEGFKWFDLGTSSVGMKARPNVFRFKEGFGAIGVFRETYEYSFA